MSKSAFLVIGILSLSLSARAGEDHSFTGQIGSVMVTISSGDLSQERGGACVVLGQKVPAAARYFSHIVTPPIYGSSKSGDISGLARSLYEALEMSGSLRDRVVVIPTTGLEATGLYGIPLALLTAVDQHSRDGGYIKYVIVPTASNEAAYLTLEAVLKSGLYAHHKVRAQARLHNDWEWMGKIIDGRAALIQLLQRANTAEEVVAIWNRRETYNSAPSRDSLLVETLREAGKSNLLSDRALKEYIFGNDARAFAEINDPQAGRTGLMGRVLSESDREARERAVAPMTEAQRTEYWKMRNRRIPALEAARRAREIR